MGQGVNFSSPLRVDGVTVVDESGKLVGDITATAGSIGTAEIADDAITAEKLADGAVTAEKLAAGAVTAEKLAVGAVDNAAIDAGIIQTAKVTLTAEEIVGTDEGCIGHTAGAVLVAAPGEGRCLEFVSAVLSYKFNTAAYTGGGDDLVIRQGTTTVTAPIAKADLLLDTEDDIAYVNALSAADIKLTANSTLNLHGTALTQPGTAAGTLDVFITYRVHTL